MSVIQAVSGWGGRCHPAAPVQSVETLPHRLLPMDVVRWVDRCWRRGSSRGERAPQGPLLLEPNQFYSSLLSSAAWLCSGLAEAGRSVEVSRAGRGGRRNSYERATVVRSDLGAEPLLLTARSASLDSSSSGPHNRRSDPSAIVVPEPGGMNEKPSWLTHNWISVEGRSRLLHSATFCWSWQVEGSTRHQEIWRGDATNNPATKFSRLD